MNEKQNNLKPCPFCGSSEVKVSMSPGGGFARFVLCQTCEAEGPSIPSWDVSFNWTEEKCLTYVVEKWNARDGDKCAKGCWIKNVIKEMVESLG